MLAVQSDRFLDVCNEVAKTHGLGHGEGAALYKKINKFLKVSTVCGAMCDVFM